MITMIYGDGEVGKSTIAIDVAARITRGAEWPQFGDDEKTRTPKGSVLILCKEDDISRVIRPRLEAAGADIKRAHIVGYPNPDSAGDFDPLDRLDGMARELEQQIAKIGDVKLVVIDPITDYVGKIDMYRDDQVRSLLNPLGFIAAKYDLVMLIILHMNKKTDMAARYRGMGSVAFRNVARSTLLVANSLERDGLRLMMLEKANLTPEKKAVAFSIRTAHAQPRIEWERDWQEQNVDEVLSGKSSTKQKQAAELLREWLKEGPLTAIEIRDLAKSHQISRGTLNLAKRAVGVKSEKHGVGNWTWSLP